MPGILESGRFQVSVTCAQRWASRYRLRPP
jgi:hypothetical protein